MVHIAMLSGGRDSTAMTIKMLQNGIDLDYILFTDTQNEFPDMYKYLSKVDAYLYRTFDKRITVLQTKKTFNGWAKGAVTKGVRKGIVRGIPMITVPCFWKRDSKVRPFEKFLKENKITKYVQYIGYTFSEENRSKVSDKNQKFPLIDLRMCEGDVDDLLKSIDLVNPLYEKFHRTGCFFCPNMRDRSFFLVHKFHKTEWEEMKSLEQELNTIDNCINPQWHVRYSLLEIEEMIKNKTWIFAGDPEKGCNCQI